MDLKITNTKPENWGDALSVALQFQADYPERRGFAAGVAFLDLRGKKTPFYAYRTKTSIVVRGDLKGAQ
ncbi:hypothetical protein B5M44_04250 [Shinella sumterensis]|uniref:hypothetical protein n=1 Tax=Shinella sumterensis TaxID=1967501 RepID=UPI00106E8661|nr:hypothetical protein [Shinella sumterensis]MCD1264048.1 hypothetical protein [Shinella sumterensis]TFE99417.1 hypothetical protein B5M44_04250 [Shinella sumterensis]